MYISEKKKTPKGGNKVMSGESAIDAFWQIKWGQARTL